MLLLKLLLHLAHEFAASCLPDNQLDRRALMVGYIGTCWQQNALIVLMPERLQDHISQRIRAHMQYALGLPIATFTSGSSSHTRSSPPAQVPQDLGPTSLTHASPAPQLTISSGVARSLPLRNAGLLEGDAGKGRLSGGRPSFFVLNPDTVWERGHCLYCNELHRTSACPAPWGTYKRVDVQMRNGSSYNQAKSGYSTAMVPYSGSGGRK